MKALNEEQVKVIKDFEEFKKNLAQKYVILRTGMLMMEKAFNDALGEQEIDNKPSAYSMTSRIENDLNHNLSLKVDKDNMLIMGILKEPVNSKDVVIKECFNFISEISIHISELEQYLDNQYDRNNFDRDIYDCKQHVNKIMNVIFEISKE